VSRLLPLCLVAYVLACAAPVCAENLYIARRGWHIDVGFAATDLLPPLDAVALDLPGSRNIFFGFGDQHYLMAKNHNASVLLSALWPGGGIILVTGLAGTPQQGFGASQVITLKLDTEQIRGLQAFIWQSLRTEKGTLSIYRNGPYEDSLYFLATHRYSALHTCNTWGAEALRAAGFKVHSAGVLFAGQLWSQARHLEQLQHAQQSSRAPLLLSPSP
jgi:hypothetical protein